MSFVGVRCALLSSAPLKQAAWPMALPRGDIPVGPLVHDVKIWGRGTPGSPSVARGGQGLGPWLPCAETPSVGSVRSDLLPLMFIVDVKCFDSFPEPFSGPLALIYFIYLCFECQHRSDPKRDKRTRLFPFEIQPSDFLSCLAFFFLQQQSLYISSWIFFNF